ncbi:MAG: hydantoinase/carbamoylase family amidase [Sebaldella sp.]|nr:hydantoinase/carbamoylase family amidase [Sebaldella sp.]
MKINMKRLMHNLYEIGEIGKTSEGYNRIEFSEEYHKAANLLLKKLKELNLKAWIDEVGNVIGEKRGVEVDENLPYIVIGSHLDTVKNGGLYDGLLGIASAIECIQVLLEENIDTNHTIRIVAFNAEEGIKLGGTFGSIVVFGANNIENENNLELLPSVGITKENIKNSAWDLPNMKLYIELHIEQGDRLYTKNKSIGIVNGIVGIIRYKIRIHGESNHGGTTAMEVRKDAVKTMSCLINYMYELSYEYKHPFVFTIGDIVVVPACYNVIPEYVELYVELRDIDNQNVEEFIEKLENYAENFKNTPIKFEKVLEKTPYILDHKIIRIIENLCEKNKISYEILSSGAGHDAMCVPENIPASMIFVPSFKGISHNIKEFTEEKDIETGTIIMLETILEADKTL